MVRDVVADMKAALERPPSDDLATLIKTLVASLGTVADSVRYQEQVCGRLADRMDALPAQIARAVRTGEVA
jgi:hypothetical protein